MKLSMEFGSFDLSFDSFLISSGDVSYALRDLLVEFIDGQYFVLIKKRYPQQYQPLLDGAVG